MSEHKQVVALALHRGGLCAQRQCASFAMSESPQWSDAHGELSAFGAIEGTLAMAKLVQHMRKLRRVQAMELAHSLTCGISQTVLSFARGRGLQHTAPSEVAGFEQSTWTVDNLKIAWQAFEIAHGRESQTGDSNLHISRGRLLHPAHLEQSACFAPGLNSDTDRISKLLRRLLMGAREEIVIFSPHWDTERFSLEVRDVKSKCHLTDVLVHLVCPPAHWLTNAQADAVRSLASTLRAAKASVCIHTPASSRDGPSTLRANFIIVDGCVGYLGSSSLSLASPQCAVEAGVVFSGATARGLHFWAMQVIKKCTVWE